MSVLGYWGQGIKRFSLELQTIHQFSQSRRRPYAKQLWFYLSPHWVCRVPDNIFWSPLAPVLRVPWSPVLPPHCRTSVGWDEEHTRTLRGAPLITVLGNLSIFVPLNIYVSQYFSVLMLTSAPCTMQLQFAIPDFVCMVGWWPNKKLAILVGIVSLLYGQFAFLELWAVPKFLNSFIFWC